MGTIFVDRQLRITRFTPAATQLINLIQADVGRPVGHIVSNLIGYNRLVDDVQTVLDSLAPQDAEVQTISGSWYQMRIRPYRTLENVIEGAVITFVDITERKRKMENDKKAVERELRRLNALLKAEQEAINSGILVVGLDVKVLRYNKRFLEIWEIPEGLVNGEIIGRLWNFEDVTERKRQDALIQNMAFYDYLTGLPNRRTFYDRLSVSLSDAKRNKQTLSVVFIDLDRFKQVNDTLGHEIGDKVLVAVTKAMKGHLRESDSLPRIGGDEFVLLLPRIDKVEDVLRVAAKFLDTFSRPITIDGHEITIGISMGAVFYPKDGDNPETFVRNADHIMYHAKQHGGNNIKIL